MQLTFAPNYVEKRLSRREASLPEARERLRTEACVLERLSLLGVTPRLLSSGDDHLGPWLRTERIAMPTLADRLVRSRRPLDRAWMEHAIRSAFEALATIHEAADDAGPMCIVHGDLSPRNLAVSDDGARTMLLDFDLAAWRDAAPPEDGAFRGTLDYVAPEVARGKPPTCSSDLFALAASLLHAASAVPPRSGRFPGEASLAPLLAAAAERPLLRDEDRQLAARGPGHAALVACLEHEPDQRPRSAREVVARLAR